MATGHSMLMIIPLELRHKIFGFVSQRERGPKKVIRTWYEKLEAEQLVAQHARTVADAAAAAQATNQAANQAATDVEAENQESIQPDDEDVQDDQNEQNIGGHHLAAVSAPPPVPSISAQTISATGGSTTPTGAGHANLASAASIWVPSRPPPVSRKWRHVPDILRVTHCPPPLNLLLACKHLHEEALDYYYDVMSLHINATASFVHQTFFEEEVFDKLCESSFSPLEQIRRITVNFVWDSKWIKNEEGIMYPVWEYELFSRARKVAELLSMTPRLQKVNVLWHDSDLSADSMELMNEVLTTLYAVLMDKPEVQIKVEELWEEDGAIVEESTTMGKQRKAFQDILAGGQNFR